MALYHEQKSTLRNMLNQCIRSGKTAEETKLLLRLTKTNMCNQCYLYALANGFGRAFCDKSQQCFLDEALQTFCQVADRKCVAPSNDETPDDVN